MKYKALILIFTAFCLAANAQQKTESPFNQIIPHEVSFALSGGMGTLMIDDADKGASTFGINGGADLGYTYMFSKTSGIHTGFGFTYLQSDYSVATVTSSYTEQSITLNDALGGYTGTARITTITHRVDEVYTSAIVSLPVQYAFRYNAFWANIGFRLAFPLSISSSYTYGPSTAEIVYFDLPDVSYNLNPVPYHDLDAEYQTGSYKARNTKIYLDASIEAGYRWMLSTEKYTSLYLGAYLDYGLTSIGTGEDAFVLVSSDTDATFNGLLNTPLIHSYNQISAGVKVSFHLGLGVSPNRYKNNTHYQNQTD